MCALQNIKFNNNICAPIFLCLVPLNTTINLYMQEPYRKCVVIFCQAAVLVDVLYCLVDRNRNAPGVDPQVIHQYCCIQNLAVHYLNATDNNSSIFYLYGSQHEIHNTLSYSNNSSRKSIVVVASYFCLVNRIPGSMMVPLTVIDKNSQYNLCMQKFTLSTTQTILTNQHFLLMLLTGNRSCMCMTCI